jgi:hypothetical protein
METASSPTGSLSMKTVGEYLADAVNFERMADDAISDEAKAAFRNLADEYRRLAIKRAKQLGYPITPPPKPEVPPNLK